MNVFFRPRESGDRFAKSLISKEQLSERNGEIVTSAFTKLCVYAVQTRIRVDRHNRTQNGIAYKLWPSVPLCFSAKAVRQRLASGGMWGGGGGGGGGGGMRAEECERRLISIEGEKK